MFFLHGPTKDTTSRYRVKNRTHGRWFWVLVRLAHIWEPGIWKWTTLQKKNLKSEILIIFDKWNTLATVDFDCGSSRIQIWYSKSNVWGTFSENDFLRILCYMIRTLIVQIEKPKCYTHYDIIMKVGHEFIMKAIQRIGWVYNSEVLLWNPNKIKRSSNSQHKYLSVY